VNGSQASGAVMADVDGQPGGRCPAGHGLRRQPRQMMCAMALIQPGPSGHDCTMSSDRLAVHDIVDKP
jgi:hypothetical protein